MENNQQKFLWLHTRKCAGTSFRKSFTPPYVQTNRGNNPLPFIAVPKHEWNDVLNNYRIPFGIYDYKRMLFAKKFLYSEEEFNSMYKFVFVRNPYDRLVSNWKFLFRHRVTDAKYLLMKHSFSYFVSNLQHLLTNQNQNHRRIAMHIAPIWPDITDENSNLLVDEVFKLEEVDEAVEVLNKKLGTNIQNLSKSNVNRQNKIYRKYYDKKTKQTMEKIYINDIEKFAYGFCFTLINLINFFIDFV